MPLQGTFDVLDFTEVLQLLAQQAATGRLHVRSRSFGANLFLEDGLLVGADQSEHQPAATAGDVKGRIEEICFEMLEAERGSFEYHPGRPSAIPVTERHDPEEVITQSRRRLEERHELQQLIPSLDLQPRLVLDLVKAEVTLDRERWRMLTAIDGRRNLRAIGRALNLSDFDVCRVMRTLLLDDIVELDGMAALPASTRDAMPVVPPPEAAGMDLVDPRAAEDDGDPATQPVETVGTVGAEDDAPAGGTAGAVPTAAGGADDAGGAAAPGASGAAADAGIAPPADDESRAEVEGEVEEGEEDEDGGRRGRRVIRIRSRQGERAKG